MIKFLIIVALLIWIGMKIDKQNKPNRESWIDTIRRR